VSTSKRERDPRGVDVAVDDEALTVSLADGRRISVPLAWFPRLMRASAEVRRNYRFIADGRGIHWPDIDEDISVSGLLRGVAAPGAKKRAI
jgi:hypothetical protein